MKRAISVVLVLLSILAVHVPVIAQKKQDPAPKAEKDPNRKLPIEWWGQNTATNPPKGSKLAALESDGWGYWGDYNFDLGKWCKKAGLYVEAKGHFAKTVEVWPDKYKKEIAEETKGGLLDKPSRAPARAVRAYRKYLENGLRTYATYYDAYARQALAEGNVEEARHGANYGLWIHADQPGIRKLRGEENIDGLGWVPVERARLLKKCVLTPEKTPKNPTAHDNTYATPETGYIVNGKHFTFASTAPWNLTALVATELDGYFDYMCKFFGKVIDAPDQKIGIFLYGQESEYREHAPSSWAAGHYDSSTGCVYLYREMDEETMDMNLHHELAHAILDYSIRGRPVSLKMDGKDTGGAHFWIKEAIAVYLERFDKTAKEQQLGSLGRRSAVVLASREKCRDLEREFNLTGTSWSTCSEDDANVNYALAGAVAVYCLSEKSDAYKEKFFNLLSETYNRTMKVEDFDAVFGLKRADFSAEFLKWFDDILIKRCKEDMEKIPGVPGERKMPEPGKVPQRPDGK